MVLPGPDPGFWKGPSSWQEATRRKGRTEEGLGLRDSGFSAGRGLTASGARRGVRPRWGLDSKAPSRYLLSNTYQLSLRNICFKDQSFKIYQSEIVVKMKSFN